MAGLPWGIELLVWGCVSTSSPSLTWSLGIGINGGRGVVPSQGSKASPLQRWTNLPGAVCPAAAGMASSPICPCPWSTRTLSTQPGSLNILCLPTALATTASVQLEPRLPLSPSPGGPVCTCPAFPSPLSESCLASPVFFFFF